jgi:hypothetical protein
MTSMEESAAGERAPLRWPRSDISRRQPESSALYAYLLDVDDDLAACFDIRMRLAARHGPLFAAAGAGPGLLVLSSRPQGCWRPPSATVTLPFMEPDAVAKLYARTARVAHGPLVRYMRQRRIRRVFDVEPEWRRRGPELTSGYQPR